ncbi:MAG: MFS transporter [Rhodospirillaceae bacterium]|nr:MFS transporter [Rhodospirillaceae bacterium]MBT4486346.1 MFS transporter [Rhodospirillaceae bacterium]MBT5897145.1 MFS transporter [Rhodospirillaceae bacterium]MBT6429095.1 MFS transporter [Rhodospirillaceae bacterium]
MIVATKESIESRYGWWVAIASTLMIATAFGSTYLVVVGLKPIAAEFGWPRRIPSAGYSAALFGAGVGGILMGLWSDRRGMMGPAMCGAICVGLGTLAISQSYSIVTFLGAHLLILGVLGNGAMFSPLLTNVTHWFDRRMGMAVAVVSSGQSLAGAIWPPVFGYFIEAYGWRETMIGYSVAAFAVLIPLSFVMRRPSPRMLRGGAVADKAARAAMAGQDEELVLGMRPNVAFSLLCLAIVGCCVAMSMPMVHIVAYCSDLGFAAARGTEMLSILLFSAFLSRVAYGWLADRVGGLRTLLLGSALQLLGLACYMYADTLEDLYMVSVFYGLGYGGIVPMYAIIIRELFHDSQAGWRIGVVFLFGTSGMAMGGYIGGFIYDLTAAYSLAFLTGIGFNLINLLLVGFMVLRQGGLGGRRGRLVLSEA